MNGVTRLAQPSGEIRVLPLEVEFPCGRRSRRVARPVSASAAAGDGWRGFHPAATRL